MNQNRNSYWPRLSSLSSIVLLFILAFSLAIPQSAYAQGSAVGGTTWYVATTGNDSNSCTAAGSPCRTINGAIEKASVSGDTIKVATGTYTGTGSEVVLIEKDIILSGGWNDGFTLRNGMSTIDAQEARRGIDSRANIIVDHFIIRNGNVDGEGGGISNRGFTLTLNNSIVTGNTATVHGGGGIWGGPTITINNSTISNNTSFDSVGGGVNGPDGGGIYILSGNVSINNTTISGNAVTNASGGGIFNSGGNVTVNNSTISGNSASRGGGIFNNQSGVMNLNNSTISGNKTLQNGFVGAAGGGISDYGGYNTGSGSLTLRNSIVAGNTTVGTSPECYSYTGIGSSGYNLIGNSLDCTFTPVTGDQVGTPSAPINPGLTPLQNNGGSTLTHGLYTNSPAANHGNPATPGSGGNACLATDQRGITRPQGSACDIGAFEGSIPPIVPTTIYPVNIITDTTPTYKWTKIFGATKYQYELWKGATLVYTKNIPASGCSTSPCSSTPTTTLSNGNYKWRVRAMIDGVWKNFSPYKTFKLFPARPGFWKGSGLEFYVINTTPKVDNFAIYISVTGCGNHKVIHYPLAAISNKKFSFGGSFYANGTFITPTKAQGALGLKSFYIPGCGYVSGGPFPWTATWKNGSQPDVMLNDGDIAEFMVTSELNTPFEILTIDPEK
ncbi:MAG: hypothetical protein HYZ21_02760 [Chloroflexi bacterium]|nr:hypothetical protein [Chloroflexota bacterium]